MRISDWSSDVCSFRSGSPGRRSRQRWAAAARPADIDPSDRGATGRKRSRRPLAVGLENGRAAAGLARRTIPTDTLIHLRPTGKFHGDARSEEHTSELQSLMRISYDVFCLTKQNK